MEAGPIVQRHRTGVARALLFTGSFIVLLLLATETPARADAPEADGDGGGGPSTGVTLQVIDASMDRTDDTLRNLSSDDPVGDTVQDLEAVVDDAVTETTDRVQDVVRGAADTMNEPTQVLDPLVGETETTHTRRTVSASPRAPAEDGRAAGYESRSRGARDGPDLGEVVRKQSPGALHLSDAEMPLSLDGLARPAARTRDEREPGNGSTAPRREATSSFATAFDRLGSPAAVLAALSALLILFPGRFGVFEAASARTRSHTWGIPPG